MASARTAHLRDLCRLLAERTGRSAGDRRAAEHEAEVRGDDDASDPLEWQNSTVLEGDLAEAVAALKQEDGGDLNVIGSAQLVRWLLEHDLVDELRLAIDPVFLGGGKGIFPSDGTLGRCGSSRARRRRPAESSRPTPGRRTRRSARGGG